METQQNRPKDYRDLSKEEVDLINRIKAKGAELLALQNELANRLDTDAEYKLYQARKSVEGKEFEGRPYTEWNGASDECIEYRRFKQAEPHRWAAIGKTDIQTGLMALTRAIAQPSGL